MASLVPDSTQLHTWLGIGDNELDQSYPSGFDSQIK